MSYAFVLGNSDVSPYPPSPIQNFLSDVICLVFGTHRYLEDKIDQTQDAVLGIPLRVLGDQPL